MLQIFAYILYVFEVIESCSNEYASHGLLGYDMMWSYRLLTAL